MGKKKPPTSKKPLSPSRAKDFVQCPKLYYYKNILGIKTPPTEATLRGTLAHYVFEHIFDRPAGDRNLDVALTYVSPAWQIIIDPLAIRDSVESGSPEDLLRTATARYRDLHEPDSESEIALLAEATLAIGTVQDRDAAKFLETVTKVVAGWYAMENPNKFTPTSRELHVEAVLGSTPVHGYIDRFDSIVDVSGSTRHYVSDYKTGKLPRDRYQDDAFFQLEVYAAILYASRNILTHQLRLVYTAAASPSGVLVRPVTVASIEKVSAKIVAISKGIARATTDNSWPTKKQVLCDWCHFKSVCPAHHPELDGLLPEEVERRVNGQ